MDDELPKRPTTFVLGSDLERHSIGDLRELEDALRQELERVRQAIASRKDVRAAAEALFKSLNAAPKDD